MRGMENKCGDEEAAPGRTVSEERLVFAKGREQQKSPRASVACYEGPVVWVLKKNWILDINVDTNVMVVERRHGSRYQRAVPGHQLCGERPTSSLVSFAHDSLEAGVRVTVLFCSAKWTDRKYQVMYLQLSPSKKKTRCQHKDVVRVNEERGL